MVCVQEVFVGLKLRCSLVESVLMFDEMMFISVTIHYIPFVFCVTDIIMIYTDQFYPVTRYKINQSINQSPSVLNIHFNDEDDDEVCVKGCTSSFYSGFLSA